jgi:hypothetical protein
MKPKPVRTAATGSAAKSFPGRRALLGVASRMDRMVREENRRWGLPLIVMRNGKIVEEPA